MPDKELAVAVTRPSTTLSRRSLTGLLGLALATPAGMAFAAPRVLRGTVIYRERMALPPTAVIEVKLLDVSLADAPSRTIAETRIRTRRQVPIPYVLRFDSRAIEPRRTYALQARITDGDRLLFINTTRHTVFAGGRDETEIRVERVASAPGPQSPQPQQGPAGRWLAEDIGGGGVIDNLQTVLEIAPDGQVSGSGGCNRIGGRATIRGQSISFGRMVATTMACAPASMNQEMKFLETLKAVRRWRIDAARGKLILIGRNGRQVMVLARM